MERTINCAECNTSYTYNEKAGYPRKYCANCSQKKKDSFKGKEPTITSEVNMETPKFKQEYKEEKPDKPKSRTADDITLGEDTKMAVSIFNTIVSTSQGSDSFIEDMRVSTDLVKQAKEGLSS